MSTFPLSAARVSSVSPLECHRLDLSSGCSLRSCVSLAVSPSVAACRASWDHSGSGSTMPTVAWREDRSKGLKTCLAE
jgi:hypothetical protein